MTKEGLVNYITLFTDMRLITITLISFTATLGTYLVSPTFPVMVSELDGVTSGNVGLVITVYAIPGIVLMPVFAVGTDLIGRRAVLLPALALFGIGGTAIAFVDSFSAILVLRLIQGMGGGALIGTAITLIGDLYSGQTASSAQGLRLSGNGLSATLTPALAGLLAGLAWHFPFLVFAIAFVPLLLAIMFIPEPIERAEDTSVWEKTQAVKGEVRSYARGLKTEITDTKLALIFLGGFVQGFSYYAILTFAPLFAVESLQATAFVGGAVLSARGFARIVIGPFAGSFLTYLSRKQMLVITSAMMAVSTGVIGVAPSVFWLVFVIGIFGIGDALFTPVHRDSLTQLSNQENRAGVVNGNSLLRNAATMTSPAFFGFVLIFSGYSTLFLVAATIFALYSIIVHFLYK